LWDGAEVKERTRRHKSHHELSETAWKSEQKVASQQHISDQKEEEEEVLKSFKQEPEEKVASCNTILKVKARTTLSIGS
jgi:hypothetical protein